MSNASLWQVQASASDGTETVANSASSNYVITFNSTTKQPSEGGFISDIIVDFIRAVPENESVNADNNELQDMGIQGLNIQIDGIMGNADYDNASNSINKLSQFLQDGNTTTGYTKGRYGLKLNNAPQWNVTPTSTYGYHIRDVKIQYIGERKDLAKFTIRLALGGDVASAI